MWFIFLIACIAVALVSSVVILIVIWAGSAVFRSIKRREKMMDVESEAYDEAKKRIKKQLEKEREE